MPVDRAQPSGNTISSVTHLAPALVDRVLLEVERAADEIVDFTSEMIRIPTVNPPGEHYEDCARYIGDTLKRLHFDIEYFAAEGRPEHTTRYPRLNVVGTRNGLRPRPTVHLNGHFDVVPAGEGWTLEPFGGIVRDGKIYGRGSCDMKAGIAAAAFASEAIRRAGVPVPGTIEVSGTVDEESGGFAGVAWLAEHGRLSSTRTDYCIIPEPLNVDRVCVGHRGVYWFEVAARGHIAHGSMPFLGVSAIDGMNQLLQIIREELMPVLASRRTEVPVVPDLARQATLNINGIFGGQPVDGIQTPCVADVCRAVFDRRFLLEEGFDATRREVEDVLARVRARVPRVEYLLKDLMVVHPDAHARRLAGDCRDRSGRQPRARPDRHARRQPGHLRSQARGADRRRAALRGLRPRRIGTGASARRVLPRGRPGELDQGAGAGNSAADRGVSQPTYPATTISSTRRAAPSGRP